MNPTSLSHYSAPLGKSKFLLLNICIVPVNRLFKSLWILIAQMLEDYNPWRTSKERIEEVEVFRKYMESEVK